MSDIDKKLREILRSHFRDVVNKSVEQHGETVVEFAERSKASREEAIAQIKQAFADEGYITPEQAKKTQELVNQMAQNAHELMKLPVTVREIGRMTGKEWYDRFAHEASQLHPVDEMKFGIVLEAAKRAAGLEEK